MWSSDLTLAPSQVRGAIRLVPVLRTTVRDDLRLSGRRVDAAMVDLGRTAYFSYIPHAYVLEWSRDGGSVASLGTCLGDTKPRGGALLHRMAKREDGETLRFLPLHLAMEGLLALHFGGPEMKWEYFSRRAIADGMSPRSESAAPGWALEGFEDALRVFEIHEGQVGVLVFVADALASAFVVPRPDDYRALHDSLLRDFYGELIWQYAALYGESAGATAKIDEAKIGSLAALRTAIAGMRADWAAFHRDAAAGLLEVPVTAQKVYQAGPFVLERFIGALDPARENHIGERILGPDGSVQYLKTFRLSSAQTKRAYLLQQLAAHDWELAATAAALRTTVPELLERFERADFGWLFHQHVMDAARAALRRRRGK